MRQSIYELFILTFHVVQESSYFLELFHYCWGKRRLRQNIYDHFYMIFKNLYDYHDILTFMGEKGACGRIDINFLYLLVMVWGWFSDVWGMFWGCFKDALVMFWGCFVDVLWMFWGCVRDVSGMF